jgi:hypothetical protein
MMAKTYLKRVWLKSPDITADQLADIAEHLAWFVEGKGREEIGLFKGDHYASCSFHFKGNFSPEQAFVFVVGWAKKLDKPFKLTALIVDTEDPKYHYGEDAEWWERYTLDYKGEDGSPFHADEMRLDQYLDKLIGIAPKDAVETLEAQMTDIEALNLEILHGEHEPRGYEYPMKFDPTSFERSARTFIRQLDDCADNISFAYGVEGRPGMCIKRLNDVANAIEKLVAK